MSDRGGGPAWLAGRGRRLALAATLSVLAGAALFVLLEVGLRSAGVEPRGYVVVDEDTCYYAWGPSTHDETEKRGTALVNRVATDAQGFRITPGEVRPAAKCRVLAVGDSFTHGQFVTAAQAFPAVIEGLAREHGYSVEVANGGMPGHTIAEERVGALGRWGALPARVVLVSHTANDLEDLVILKRGGCRIDGPPPIELRPALNGTLQDLRLLKVGQEVAARIELLSPRMRRLRLGGAPELRRPAGAEECAAAEQAYLALSLDLAGALSARGTKLLFAFVEGFFCGGASPRAFQADFTRRLGEAGALVIDATSALRDPEASLRPADSHPSPLGHGRIATRIEAALQASGWLQGCE